jgi:hypothetical protein
MLVSSGRVRVLVFSAALALAACKDAKTGVSKDVSGRPPDANLEPCQAGVACACEDGIDNDNDGLVDWHFDLGCSARNDSTEGGVATGALEGGWTVFEPSSATQIIYVSAEGNDEWDGRVGQPNGSTGPKRTFNAAMQAMRPGQADWILLRRGDTFEGSVSLRVSGRSPNEPVLIASYGPDTTRPVVQGGIFLNDGGQQNFAIAHLDLREGFSAAAAADGVLVEGCYLQGAAGITATGGTVTHSNWRIRRNVVSRSNDSGLYFYSIAGLLVEENVVYRPATLAPGNHGMYFTRRGNSDVVTRHNIVYVDKPQGNGIMQRPGGLAEGNVVGAVGWSGIAFGACNDGDGTDCYPPVTALARGNLILERRGENGCGIEFHEQHVSSGEATDTIFADDRAEAWCPPITQRSFVTETGTVRLPSPADPQRPGTLLGAFNAVQGGEATTEAFFTQATQQRKFAYRPELGADRIIEFARTLMPQAP